MPFAALTPRRRRGAEILDDPDADPALAVRSLHDVAKANRWFGGTRAVVRVADRILASLPAAPPRSIHPASAPSANDIPSILDVGTGLGDIPAALLRRARRRGAAITTIGLELSPALAREAATRASFAFVGDAMRLPLADASVDVVTISQVLHHFDDDEATTLLRECARVARTAVVVADLRRSWFAIAGLWASSFVLGFHPVSRHDGIVSILRGYTAPELEALIARAVGGTPDVNDAPFSRVTAVWTRPSRRH